jgi:hypothetical protein
MNDHRMAMHAHQWPSMTTHTMNAWSCMVTGVLPNNARHTVGRISTLKLKE